MGRLTKDVELKYLGNGTPRVESMNKCKVENCNSKVKQNGYCSKHYSQVYRHGRLTPEKERRAYGENEKCEHEGCEELAKCRGLCRVHYHQFRNYGKTYNKQALDNVIEKDVKMATLHIFNNAKEIVVSALIDIEDTDRVKKYKWYYDGRYITRTDGAISLHRYLINCPKGKVVDHINHNKLDNRKINLRICSIAENARSHKGYSTNSTGRTGVYLEKNKWRARIRIDNKILHLGIFENKKEAIKTRERAELKYFGEFKPLR